MSLVVVHPEVMLATTVADVMTTSVVSAPPDAPFAMLVRLVIEHRISAVPIVTGDGRMLGVVSEADLLVKESHPGQRTAPPMRSGGRSWRIWRKSSAQLAADVMSPAPRTVRPELSLTEAARQLESSGLRRLFVTDADGVVVGVLARRDVLRVFTRGDDDLAAAIGSALQATSEDSDGIRVAVSDGVVQLSGTVEDHSSSIRAEHAAGRVPGVVTVQNTIAVTTGPNVSQDSRQDRSSG